MRELEAVSTSLREEMSEYFKKCFPRDLLQGHWQSCIPKLLNGSFLKPGESQGVSFKSQVCHKMSPLVILSATPASVGHL